MKRFLLFLSVLASVAMPVKAATGLSSVLFTNLNAQYFLLSLAGAPTNMVALTYQRAGTNLASINPTIGRVPYKGSATALADTAIEYVDANTVSVPEMDLGSMVVTNLTNGGPVVSYTSGVVTNIPHGSGALTNDGAGNLGYYDYSTGNAANWTASGTTNSTLAGTARAGSFFYASPTALTATDAGVAISLANGIGTTLLTLTGAVSITFSDLAAGNVHELMIINSQATNCPITWGTPHVPIGIDHDHNTAGKALSITLRSWSATTNNLYRYGQEQP